MALDGSSTRDDVLQAMGDNASYLETNDVEKCRRYITACTIFLGRFALSQAGGGSSMVQTRPELVEKMLDSARKWLSANSPPPSTVNNGGNVTYYSIEGFRD